MCCAGRALQMGFKDDFDKEREANIKAFREGGREDHRHPLLRLLPRLQAPVCRSSGMNIEVLHIVEYLDRLIPEGKLNFTKKVPLTVTYHDPCHLGRLGEPYVAWNGKEKKILNQVHTWEPRRPRYNGAYGIYDAPRNILKRIPGVNLVEMETDPRILLVLRCGRRDAAKPTPNSPPGPPRSGSPRPTRPEPRPW